MMGVSLYRLRLIDATFDGLLMLVQRAIYLEFLKIGHLYMSS